MGVSKLPRSRYQITSFFGNKSTVEGKDIKNPTTRAQYQAYATPYKSSAEERSKTQAVNDQITVKAAFAKQERQGRLAKADNSKRITDKGVRGLTPAKAPLTPAARPVARPSVASANTRKEDYASKPSVASANTRKEDYPLKKGSTQPPAYKGVKGDSATKRGAVTSYQANGYTYTKNAQGNYQNFKAGSQPTKRKGSER